MFIGSGDATMAAQNYYCAALIFSLVFQIPPEIVVASTVTTPPPGATHIWVPPYSDYIPASPVRYELAETEAICLVLSITAVAVVSTNSSDGTLEFSVDLAQEIPLNLTQRKDRCDESEDVTCSFLIITAESSDLPEGEFQIYFGKRSTRTTFGPLGLTNPSGGHVLQFSASNSIRRLTYRPEIMEQVKFRVCGNRTVPDFQVSPPSRRQCQQGPIAGGFSLPFDVIVTYVGDFPVPEGNYTITSSNCTDPDAGVSLIFIIPKMSSSTLSIIPSFTTLPSSTVVSATNSITMEVEDSTAPPTSAATRVNLFASIGAIIIIIIIVLVSSVLTTFIGIQFKKRNRQNIVDLQSTSESLPPTSFSSLQQPEDFPRVHGVKDNEKPLASMTQSLPANVAGNIHPAALETEEPRDKNCSSLLSNLQPEKVPEENPMKSSYHSDNEDGQVKGTLNEMIEDAVEKSWEKRTASFDGIKRKVKKVEQRVDELEDKSYQNTLSDQDHQETELERTRAHSSP